MSLPPASQGTLFLNGVLVTTLAQVTGLTPAQAAQLSFTPAPGFTGMAGFDYNTVDNNGAVSGTAIYDIPVRNIPPVTVSYTTPSMPATNGATAIPSLIGTDANGVVSSYTVSTIPSAAQGVLTLNGVDVVAGQVLTPAQAAALQFNPAPGFAGNATFNYTATDNQGAISNTSTVTIPVTNPAPVANNIMTQPVSNSAAQTAIPTLTGGDVNGTVATFAITSLPTAAQGALYLNGVLVTTLAQVANLTPAQAAQLTFDPAAGFVGNVTLNYTSTDNQGATSSPATITIPVVSGVAVPAQQPPLANNITAPSMSNGNGNTAIPQFLASDLNGAVVNYTVATIPPASQGILTAIIGGVRVPVTAGQILTATQMATLNFDPAAGFVGNASFTYFATDNNNLTSNTATYTIPVSNIAPIANPIVSTVANGSTQAAIPSLSGTDVNGTIASYSITSLPTVAQGTLFLNGVAVTTLAQVASLTPAQAAQLSFTPAAGFTGVAPFNYTTTDNNGAVSNPTSYTINVGPVVSAGAAPLVTNVTTTPIANPAGTGGVALSTPITGTDPNGNATITSYTITALPLATQGTLLYQATVGGPFIAVPLNTTLTPAQAATVRFDPADGFVGNANFTYIATDNTGNASAPATYTMPITNAPPTAANVLAPSQLSGTGPTAIPTLNGGDVDGTVANYTITSLPPTGQGTLFLNGVAVTNLSQVANLTPAQAATLSFTSPAGFNGFVNFTYTVTDNSGNVGNVANYIIPVGSATVLPISIISFTGTENGTVVFTSWAIADAVNVSHFEVLSSTNGNTFKALGTVTFVNGVAVYNFKDENAANGINYYKLKIVDKDGKISYSNIIVVKFGKGKNDIQIYPNPVADILYINFAANHIGKQATVRLLDIRGRLILNKSEKISNTITSVNMTNLQASTYVVQIIVDNEIINSTKVIRK